MEMDASARRVVESQFPQCLTVEDVTSITKTMVHRSSLFVHVPRIKDLVKECFPWAQVRCLIESVASMDEHDREVMSEEIGLIPWLIDAGQFSLARRPRVYWLDWELFQDSKLTLAPGVDRG